MKLADGTEDEGAGTVDFVTSAGANMVAHVWRVTNWFNALSGVEVGVAETKLHNSGNQPNPPSLTASWGALENLWFVFSSGTNDDNLYTAGPAGYSDFTEHVTGAGSGTLGGEIAGAHLASAVATEDPGEFTLDGSESVVSQTLVVQPSGFATLRRRMEDY